MNTIAEIQKQIMELKKVRKTFDGLLSVPGDPGSGRYRGRFLRVK